MEQKTCLNCEKQAIITVVVERDEEYLLVSSCNEKECFASCNNILAKSKCFMQCGNSIWPVEPQNWCQVANTKDPVIKYALCSMKCKELFKQFWEAKKIDESMKKLLANKPGLYINTDTGTVFNGLAQNE